MTKNKNKSNIKCNVDNCKYNNNEEEVCEKEEIKVGCSDEVDECSCKDDTACKSFKEEVDNDIDNDDDDERIADTVYEVEAKYNNTDQEIEGEEKED